MPGNLPVGGHAHLLVHIIAWRFLINVSLYQKVLADFWDLRWVQWGRQQFLWDQGHFGGWNFYYTIYISFLS
ncbi:hypothetical protein RhiXN_04924 [Rhizoctonia solani]|uniref:Uncharacterized protein n=1 Tax=Rhizoctonia solani TaxID=456999 RepID=A0A8H8NRH1_9AGAM|nr:uncharacterized protein RhiXN_04924 [Rhizoctonia solani]QRW16922.1 hypothetical protein RhiXN_04924 [Rhizoctonia solani]